MFAPLLHPLSLKWRIESNLWFFGLVSHLLLNNLIVFNSKPKRQPYKRQLVASANGSIELECLDDEETNQCEEDKNHNSPDYCYENENGFYEKPYKPKHKRLKLNGPTNNENNLSYENNQMNLLSNNAVNSNNIDTKVDKDNRCDNQQNGTNIDHNDDDKSMFISNKQNQNRFKLLTYSTEYFDSKEVN